MRLKSTWILLLLVLGLGAFIILVEQDWDSTAERKILAKRAFRIQPEKITFLRFENKGMRIDCRFDGQDWILDYPSGARIKAGVVFSVLTAMSKIEKGTLFTPEELELSNRSLHDFGLDEPRARITYGTELAQRTLLIGKDAPLGDVLYVKDMGQPHVMTVDANLLTLIPSSWADMRVRDVFTIAPEDVQRVEIRQKGAFVVFEKRHGDSWSISQPRVNTAEASAVNGLLEKLSALRVEAFLDRSAEPVEWSGESDYVRLQGTGERDGQTVYFNGIDKASGKVRARVDGDELDILLPTELPKLLSINIDQFSLPTLYPEQEMNPTNIVWRLGEDALMLSHSGQWQLDQPALWPTHVKRVENLIERIKGLEAKRFLTGAEVSAIESTNLSAVAQLDLAFAEGSGVEQKEQAWHLEFYRVPAFKDEVVFHVPSGRLWGLLKNQGELSWPYDPLYYRSPVALSVDDAVVVRLAQRTNGVETVVLRDEETATWTNSGVSVDPAPIQSMLKQLVNLRVIRWVEYLPTDLEPYGLHQPRLQLALGYSGTDSIGNTLLIGGEDEKGNCYGKLLGKDVIFLLSKAETEALLAPIMVAAKAPDEESTEPQSKN